MYQTLDVFMTLRDRLVERLQQAGFSITMERKDDAFGSHFVTLVKDDRGIQLVWDGRDYELAIAVNENLSKQPYRGWIRVATEGMPRPPWDEDTSKKAIQSIGDGIASLQI